MVGWEMMISPEVVRKEGGSVTEGIIYTSGRVAKLFKKTNVINKNVIEDGGIARRTCADHIPRATCCLIYFFSLYDS